MHGGLISSALQSHGELIRPLYGGGRQKSIVGCREVGKNWYINAKYIVIKMLLQIALATYRIVSCDLNDAC